MEKDLEIKIKSHLEIGPKISESEVRSLMTLISKRLELMVDVEKQNYLTLSLFCNWCKHTKIDQSNTGLRIIAKVNDALVEGKDYQDNSKIELKISQAIGYVSLRRGLILFLNSIGFDGYFEVSPEGNNFWGHFLTHLFEIIRDVPIVFPSIASLDKTKQKIYNQIARSAIRPGAGVIGMKITKVDYSKMGMKNMGELISLHIKLENTTNVIVPLLFDVNSI